MPDGKPPAVDLVDETLRAYTGRLRGDLAAASEAIEAELAEILTRWPGQTKPVRYGVLRDLQTHVGTLMGSAREAIAQATPEALAASYDLGATVTALTAQTSATFAAVDKSVLSRLAGDTYGELLEATQYMEDTTKDVVRRLGREHGADKILTGRTAEQQAARLAADLQGQGIAAITYRNGADHTLADYADMLLRTKSAEAYQLGGLNQGKALGIEWWEILDNPACGLDGHNDPTRANGLIVRTETAERFPLSHPRCVRCTTARPDVTSPEQAGAARASLQQPRQVADQQLVEMAREDVVARRAGLEQAADTVRRPGLGTRVDELRGRRSDGTVDLSADAATSAAAQRRAAKVARRQPTPPVDRFTDLSTRVDHLGLDDLDELAADPRAFANVDLAGRLEARYDALDRQRLTAAEAALEQEATRVAARTFYDRQIELDRAAAAAKAKLPPPRPTTSRARVEQREQFDLWLEQAMLDAEDATRGNLLTREGTARGISPLQLFTSDPRQVIRYASEELLRWWAADSRRRITWSEWRGPNTKSGRASRAAFEDALQSIDYGGSGPRRRRR